VNRNYFTDKNRAGYNVLKKLELICQDLKIKEASKFFSSQTDLRHIYGNSMEMSRCQALMASKSYTLD
jgi:hypothetical protein